MQDIMSKLSALRRPRLLIRAAKIGAQDYCREQHLQRILGYGAIPGPGSALMRLMDLEREVDMSRRDNDAAYSLVQHLDLLIALMGEAQLFQASRASQYR